MNCASTESAAVREGKEDIVLDTRNKGRCRGNHSTLVHFEIPADNVERAKSFYSTLFGWEVKETGWILFLISRLVVADFR
ncbi:MAG: hypothetical protein ACLQGU_10185 [bacterium]